MWVRFDYHTIFYLSKIINILKIKLPRYPNNDKHRAVCDSLFSK